MPTSGRGFVSKPVQTSRNIHPRHFQLCALGGRSSMQACMPAVDTAMAPSLLTAAPQLRRCHASTSVVSGRPREWVGAVVTWCCSHLQGPPTHLLDHVTSPSSHGPFHTLWAFHAPQQKGAAATSLDASPAGRSPHCSRPSATERGRAGCHQPAQALLPGQRTHLLPELPLQPRQLELLGLNQRCQLGTLHMQRALSGWSACACSSSHAAGRGVPFVPLAGLRIG